MSNFKIDKNIPVVKRRWKKRKYPFLKMNVGDSFFVRNCTYATAKCLRSNARYARPRKFVTRAVSGGYRVWRIK